MATLFSAAFNRGKIVIEHGEKKIESLTISGGRCRIHELTDFKKFLRENVEVIYFVDTEGNAFVYRILKPKWIRNLFKVIGVLGLVSLLKDFVKLMVD